MRNNVDKVQNFPQLQTVKELRQFLGMISFERKFLKDCAKMGKLLCAHTGRGPNEIKLDRREESESGFQKIKGSDS